MKGFPFMVDFNTLGFHTFDNLAEFHAWLQNSRQSDMWRGDNHVLDARVGGQEDVARVELGARLATPGPFGYGLDPDVPTFGYRREHRGSFTLREYLQAHEIPFPSETP